MKQSTQQQSQEVNAAIVAESLRKEAAPLFKRLATITIVDMDTYNAKAERIEALKKISKMALAKQSSLIDPLKKVIDEIKDLFSPFIKSVAEAERVGKIEMMGYIDKMERQKNKLAQQVADGKIAKISTITKKAEALEIKSDAATIRKIWTVVEVDANVTPREYLVPDETKIREALKSGKKVLGWEYKQVNSITI